MQNINYGKIQFWGEPNYSDEALIIECLVMSIQVNDWF
jgi:hypothetical protein